MTRMYQLTAAAFVIAASSIAVIFPQETSAVLLWIGEGFSHIKG